MEARAAVAAVAGEVAAEAVAEIGPTSPCCLPQGLSSRYTQLCCVHWTLPPGTLCVWLSG